MKQYLMKGAGIEVKEGENKLPSKLSYSWTLSSSFVDDRRKGAAAKDY